MALRINLTAFVLGVILLFIFFGSSDLFFVLLATCCILFFLVLSCGVLFLRLAYFIPSTSKLKSRKVLLTFDDGPDEINTTKILDILKEENTVALFFLIGEKAVANPDLVKRMLDEGHMIGNHTWSHPLFFAMMDGKRVGEEVDQWDHEMNLHFQLNANLFRPPIGYTNPIIARVLKKREKKVIAWSKRSYDTVLKTQEKLLRRMVRITKPGDIVLLHDNLPQTAAMLSTYIRTLRENGVIFAQSDDLKSIVNDF